MSGTNKWQNVSLVLLADLANHQIDFISRGYTFIIPPDQTVAAEQDRSSDAESQHSITDSLLPKKKSWANPRYPALGTEHFGSEIYS